MHGKRAQRPCRHRPSEKSSNPNKPPLVLVTIDDVGSADLAPSVKVMRDIFAAMLSKKLPSKKLPSKKHIHVGWHDPLGEAVADAIGKLY